MDYIYARSKLRRWAKSVTEGMFTTPDYYDQRRTLPGCRAMFDDGEALLLKRERNLHQRDIAVGYTNLTTIHAFNARNCQLGWNESYSVYRIISRFLNRSVTATFGNWRVTGQVWPNRKLLTLVSSLRVQSIHIPNKFFTMRFLTSKDCVQAMQEFCLYGMPVEMLIDQLLERSTTFREAWEKLQVVNG